MNFGYRFSIHLYWLKIEGKKWAVINKTLDGSIYPVFVLVVNAISQSKNGWGKCIFYLVKLGIFNSIKKSFEFAEVHFHFSSWPEFVELVWYG